MAASGSNLPPIIIKKHKHADHDFHGGHWKVALADFMTSMFIIFLMLWLVNQVTPSQRQGIADYFSPQSVSKQTTGSGSILGGQTVTVPGASVSPTSPLGVVGQGMPSPTQGIGEGPTEQDGFAGRMKEREIANAREDTNFQQVQVLVQQAIGSLPDLQGLSSNVAFEKTEEGMLVHILDNEKQSMFGSGGATPTPQVQQLLGVVAKQIAALPNKIQVAGHTDATPFPAGSGFTNWELSANRAAAARRILAANGVGDDRINSVVGKADRDLRIPEDPRAPGNRRITLMLLREPTPPSASAAPGTPGGPTAASATVNGPAGTGVAGSIQPGSGTNANGIALRPQGSTSVTAGPAPEGPLIRR